MNYQQPYNGQPPQGYPPAQQQGYAQPYPPQAPPFQGQAPGPYQGQPGQAPAYAPPQPPQGYPPVNYQQPPQAPPAPPAAPNTVRDFWDQPSSGGKALSFDHVGTRYVCTVVRTVTDADIQDQTDIMDPTKVATFNDGRVKKMMLVPVLLHQPTAEFPDGTATWYVRGNVKGELTRAMEAAGLSPDPETGYMPVPRAGDVIDITYTHDKPMGRGMNAMKVMRVVYQPGNGIAPEMQAPVPVQQPQVYQQLPQYPGAGYNQPQVYQQPVTQPAPGTQTVGMNPYQNYTVSTPGTFAYQPPAPQAQPQNGPYGQPNADWNPYAQPFPTTAPTPQTAGAAAPGYGSPTAPPAQPPQTAYATAPAAPSDVPPPDWPADVPFRKGLTVEQARMAALHNIPVPQ